MKDRFSEERTAFNNHAFASIMDKILDACAGPHAGTESLEQYIEHAIDAEASRPALKISDARVCPAVVKGMAAHGFLGVTQLERGK